MFVIRERLYAHPVDRYPKNTQLQDFNVFPLLQVEGV